MPLIPEWVGNDYPTNYDGATTTRLEGDSVGRYGHGDPHPPKTV
jgi:hypothetical protein